MARVLWTLAAAAILPLTPALAKEDDTYPWVVAEVSEGRRLAREEAWSASLWLPYADGDTTRYADRCLRHAAVLEGPPQGCFVTVRALVAPPGEARYDPSRARLTGPDGEVLHPTGRPLGPFAADSGVRDIGHGERVELTYLLSFARFDRAWTRVEVQIPAGEPDAAPLVVVFQRRLEWRTERAEEDLQAWKAHALAPETRRRSAIPPYLDVEAYRAFRDHGERYVVPLLLRELARGESGAQDALPRLLVFHVLADTEWGRAHGPGAGDAQDAAALLRAWREAGEPRLPGVAPEER